MSRTIAPAEQDRDTFVGLLEQFTRRDDRLTLSGAARLLDSDLRRSANLDFEPGIADSAVSEVGSRGRRLASAQTARKSMKARDSEGFAPLSYEDALRIHGRCRQEDEDGFDAAPQIPPTGAAANLKSVPSPADARLKGRQSGSASPTPTPVSKPRPKQASAPARQNASKPVSAAMERTSAAVAKPATRPADKTAVSGSSPDRPGTMPAKPKSSRQATHRRAKSSGPGAQISSPLPAGQQTLVSLRKEQKAAPAGQVLARQARAIPPDHRKSIVSLRLNEEELDRLRLRAEESGVSVSAYMRSCVLEAEHLRAQVKQALAEMRSASVRQEPIQLPAVTPERARHGGVWSWFLSRSATFLLGPWFAFRPRT